MESKRKLKRERPGLVDYLDQRMGTHQGQWPELQWFCPFCIDRVGDESSARKLRFNVESGRCICFRCEFRSADMLGFFKALNKGPVRLSELSLIRGEFQTEYLPKLKSRVLSVLFATKAQAAGTAENPLKPVKLPREYVPLWGGKVPPAARRGWNYATLPKPLGRGLSPSIVEKFRIGFCPTGDYGQRLIFPVTLNGTQVYFTNRYCGNFHVAKSKNPPNVEGYFHASHCLLNFDNVVGAKVVTVVEGPIDCTAPDAAVCLMGKRMSPHQVALCEVLAEYGTEEFVVGTDADADPGAIYSELTGRVPKVTVLGLRHGDPDSRRDELPALQGERHGMTLSDRVRARLGKSK